jgi:hypothetical protein
VAAVVPAAWPLTLGVAQALTARASKTRKANRVRMVADPTCVSAEFRNALLAVLIVAVDSNR